MDPALERRCVEMTPLERSGHTAVVEENLLFVWGGCRVRRTTTVVLNASHFTKGVLQTLKNKQNEPTRGYVEKVQLLSLSFNQYFSCLLLLGPCFFNDLPLCVSKCCFVSNVL